MDVLFKSFHNIDVTNAQYVRKELPEDFNAFVIDYISFATQNENVKAYNVVDENVTVINCISKIIEGTYSVPERTEDVLETLLEYSDSIANKLLKEESQAQIKISVMGKYIKKGSLIQALVKDDLGDTFYIIAKVEHSEWYDGDSLKKNLGFPSEKKNVWKSAVIPFIYDEEISFDNVRVYTDNSAKYWAENFLEVSEKRNDSTNTKNACDAIEYELKRSVKLKSLSDYYNLRNSLIRKLKTSQQINYSDLINGLFDDYVPDEAELNMDAIKQKFLELPEKKNFDRQFNSVPSAIKKRCKLNFKVTPSIDLKINESIGNYRESVVSTTDSQGKKYLLIECREDKTYEAFKEKRGILLN